jgi:hypothetical protein
MTFKLLDSFEGLLDREVGAGQDQCSREHYEEGQHRLSIKAAS